jgi:hypothetical protein
MKMNNFFSLVLLILIVSACGSSDNQRAKRILQTKIKISPTRTAFNPDSLKIICDSVNFLATGNDLKNQKLIIRNGNIPIDTMEFMKIKLTEGFESEFIKADLNFDGNCDFIVPDKNIKKGGCLKHYYFMYDTISQNFIENTTLPSFISSFKLDIKNQRVKLYCPMDDCFAYYKYNADKKFELVQGEFKSID